MFDDDFGIELLRHGMAYQRTTLGLVGETILGKRLESRHARGHVMKDTPKDFELEMTV